MNNWISKAANVFKRDVEETPQPFELACECGQTHGGIRRGRHQHIVCKACGLSLFVLPRDVFPPPLDRKPSKQNKKKKTGTVQPEVLELEDSSESNEQVLDEVVVLEKIAPRHRMQKQKEAADAGVPHKRKKSIKETASPPPATPGFFARLGVSLKSAGQSFIKFWTPFRLAMLGIGVSMAVAVYWSVQEGIRSRAVASVNKYTEEGMQAVNVQDWLNARRAFEQASRAVDVLGRHDPEAESIRHYHKETQALTNLCIVNFFDLLEIAETTYEKDGAEAWQQQFLTYQDDWFVMTGPVQRLTISTADTGESNTYELYLPWSPGQKGNKVSIRGNFADFEHVVPAQAKIVTTFAGELASCVFSKTERMWIVTLRSETGFVWTHPDTFAGLNFESTELESEQDLKNRLTRQAELVGGKQ